MAKDNEGFVFPQFQRERHEESPYELMAGRSSAFPNIGASWADEPGITLRDYLAARAIAGLLSNPAVLAATKSDSPSSELAKSAYDIADAMLKARQQ